MPIATMSIEKSDFEQLPVEQRIGRRIKAIRALRGLSQKQLADECGISNQTICNIETGKADFKISTLRVIERVLKCTLIVVPNEDLI